jgi:pimeloyl-ACP methyl ester carboxylesterase
MRRRLALLAALAALAPALAGCGGGTEPSTTATDAGDVRAPAPTADDVAARLADDAPARLRDASDCGQPETFRCQALTVPLHRRGPHARDGKTLTLRVAVQKAHGPRGDLVLLTGGPGQPGIPFAARMAKRLRGAIDGYRLVLVDQRGTGADALRCDGLQREVGASDIAAPSERAVTACARTLGDARDAYATADTVEDLDALRRGLGLDTWVVGGVSYGTFVAQRLALAHPHTIDALVLDSVVPQAGAELLLRDPQRAVGRVLRAVCGAACVDDLRTLLRADGPLGPRVLDALVERSIGVPRLDGIGPILHAAVTNDRRPLTRLLDATGDGDVPPRIFSAGLHAATLCADSPAPWPGGPSASFAVRGSAADAQQARMGPRATDPFPVSTSFGQGLFVTCRAWPVTPAPPAPDPAARIAAPALLLAGDRDLSTPLEWARAQAALMPHARLVVVRGAGHAVLSREAGIAGRDALRGFLEDLNGG